MTARLFCKTGQLAGASFDIKGEATIGKNPDNSIQLYPGLISGRHARIYYDEAAHAYILEDLNSRNGTRLDGIRVRGKERLGKLHIITFANTFDFFFQVVEHRQDRKMTSGPAQKEMPKAKTQSPKEKPSFIPQPPAPVEDRQNTVFDDEPLFSPDLLQQKQEGVPPGHDVERTKVGVEFTPVPSFKEPSKPPKPEQEVEKAGGFVLVFESLKGKPQAFDLREGSTILGREASCTIFVDDPSVSRRHAEIVFRGGRLTLKDLGSKNHTYIDDQRISKEVELTEGRKITLGLVSARIVRKPSR